MQRNQFLLELARKNKFGYVCSEGISVTNISDLSVNSSLEMATIENEKIAKKTLLQERAVIQSNILLDPPEIISLKEIQVHTEDLKSNNLILDNDKENFESFGQGIQTVAVENREEMVYDKIFTELVVMNTIPVGNNNESVNISVEPLENVNKFIPSELNRSEDSNNPNHTFFQNLTLQDNIHRTFAENPYFNHQEDNAVHTVTEIDFNQLDSPKTNTIVKTAFPEIDSEDNEISFDDLYSSESEYIPSDGTYSEDSNSHDTYSDDPDNTKVKGVLEVTKTYSKKGLIGPKTGADKNIIEEKMVRQI